MIAEKFRTFSTSLASGRLDDLHKYFATEIHLYLTTPLIVHLIVSADGNVRNLSSHLHPNLRPTTSETSEFFQATSIQPSGERRPKRPNFFKPPPSNPEVNDGRNIRNFSSHLHPTLRRTKTNEQTDQTLSLRASASFLNKI